MTRPKTQADEIAPPPGAAEIFPFWMTFAQAQRYVGNRTLKAFYQWRKDHGIVCRNNRTVSRLDLDKALRVKRKPVLVSAVSLANLRRRHAQQSSAPGSIATGPDDVQLTDEEASRMRPALDVMPSEAADTYRRTRANRTVPTASPVRPRRGRKKT